MSRMVHRGAIPAAIGGIAIVLAMAIVGRVGAAGERQTSGPPPSAAGSGPASPPAQRPAPVRSTARVDYEREIKPILSENCLECHSQDKRKGGLSLATYGDVLDGGKDGAVVRPGNSARSMMIARVKGEQGDRMPLDELPLERRADRAAAALDRRGGEGDARPPRRRRRRGRRRSRSPHQPFLPWCGRPGSVLPIGSSRPTCRSAGVRQPALDRRRGVRPTSLPRSVGPAAVAGRPAGVRRRHDAGQARPSRGHAPRRQPEVRRALDLVLERSPAQRGRPDLLLRAERTAQHHRLADGGVDQQPAVRPVRREAPQSEPAGRSRGLSDRRQLARRDQRRGDALDAGVAEHRAGVPRREFQVQCLPRQLRQQVEAEGRLRARRVFLARAEAAALSGATSPATSSPSRPSSIPSFAARPRRRRSTARRATAAAIFTDPRNGRMPRTVVNRFWTKLVGHGIVPNSDEMDGKPWSPELLDWLASDFVAHQYDLKHLIATIISSRAYQMPAVRADGRSAGPQLRVPRPGDPPPHRRAVRRCDRHDHGRVERAERRSDGEWRRRARDPGTDSDSPTSGVYVREYRNNSSHLTRALGRPIRDQVTSIRAVEATTLQSLELVNGEILTSWLMRGARRMIGELPDDPLSLFNASVAGRNLQPRAFDADVSRASKLWLIISDTGSNAPERVLPTFVKAEFVGPGGAVPLSALTPIDGSGLRAAAGAATPDRVPVKNSSRLVYDISGKGFTRFRGSVDVDNARADIGSTLNPAMRFFIFDTEPNMTRLLPPAAGMPLPGPAPVTTVGAVVDHVFWSALGRAPVSVRASSRGSGDRRSHTARKGVAGRGRRSAVGGLDEARVSVDLLSMSTSTSGFHSLRPEPFYKRARRSGAPDLMPLLLVRGVRYSRGSLEIGWELVVDPKEENDSSADQRRTPHLPSAHPPRLHRRHRRGHAGVARRARAGAARRATGRRSASGRYR